MKIKSCGVVATALLFIPALGFANDAKTYSHASEYQVAILDQNLRGATESDVTLGKNMTDAKLGPGVQRIHLLHTDAGDYLVEAPINKGLTFLSAMGSIAYNPAKTYPNKWFLDNVQPGTKVLFLSQPFGATLQQLRRLALGELQAAGVLRIEIPEAKSLAAADAEGPNVLLEAIEDEISRHSPGSMLPGTVGVSRAPAALPNRAQPLNLRG